MNNNSDISIQNLSTSIFKQPKSGIDLGRPVEKEEKMLRKLLLTNHTNNCIYLQSNSSARLKAFANISVQHLETWLDSSGSPELITHTQSTNLHVFQ